MRTPLFLILAVAAATVAAPAASVDRATAEERLAKATAGLVAGEPVDCISERLPTRLEAAGPRLIYKVSRGLVYVNETAGGCENVGRGDALVTRSYTSRLCRGDIGQTVDLVAKTPTGSCSLGSFIPYRAPR